jgi:uncharacterized protein
MQKIFVDTSAFYALLDRSDKYHKQASLLWPGLLDEETGLVTTNYVVWETIGLLQNRIGYEAANLWCKDVLAVLDILWVNEAIHQRAMDLWNNLGRLRVSFTDCVSFVIMHQKGIETAFCFKKHFEEHGFILVPEKTLRHSA